MKLQSLSIQGFGKFRNFTLDLSEGLNIIYGLNEAGKSTLHAFIEGMFYGFIDGTKKKRSFLGAHEKYAPRDNAPYQGSLTFTHEGGKYRLERNFAKRKGFVKLINAKTGKDITDEYPAHPVRKEIDLARFLDMPYTLFKNTLSIAQLSAETDNEAGSELLRRLQNTKETKSESMSMSRAIESLEDKIKAIGTERARTRPYAKALDKLETLKSEYDQAQAAHEATLEEKNRLDALRDEDAHLKTEKASLEKSLETLENTRKMRTYRTIQKTLHKLETDLKEVSENPPGLSVDGLNDLKATHSDAFDTLESNKDSLFDSLSKLESVNKRLSTLNPLVEKTPFKQIEDDFERLKALREKKTESDARIKELTSLKEEKEKTFEVSRDKLHGQVNTFTHKWPFASMLIIAATLAGYFVFDLAWAFWLLALPIASGIFLFIRNRKQVEVVKGHLNAFDEAEASLEKEKASLKIATDSIQKLIGRYNLKDSDAFEPLYYESKNAVDDQAYRQTLYDAIDDILKSHTPLLDAFGLSKDHASLRESFNAIKKVKDAWREINGYLDGQSFKVFKEKIDFEADEVDPARKNDIDDALSDIEKTLHEHAIERSRKEEAIENKEARTRELSTIDYELKETRRQIEAYDKEKRIFENAIERLKSVQKDIEEHFAPIMNENTEKYLSILTGETYDSIKVKKDLSFTALSNATGQLEDEAFFSKGTLDQIYIAMRLGILATLGKSDYPFFLDDAFTQFDEERLVGALKLVDTMAKERQILLFTCHTREQTLLKNKGIPYKAHTLK